MRYDYAAEARRLRAVAAGFTREATRAAYRADGFYQMAAQTWRAAAWATAHPELWPYGLDPAAHEDSARAWAGCGDTMLRSSFHATKMAADYADMAARNTARTQAPTTRQGTVLRTLAMGQKMTAAEIGVRSDVLWRMEERGWVARAMAPTPAQEKWHILSAGVAAIGEVT
jgi:hypothetical protein